MAIKGAFTFLEMVARLTRGFIRETGKQPDGLAKLKIKMEAAERIKQQNKVKSLQDFKDKKGIKSLPVNEQFTTKEKGFIPMKAEQYRAMFGKSPKPKVEPIKKVLSDDEATAQINKLREDFNFNDRKQVLQLFDDIDAGKAFGAFDDIQKKELRDMISKMYTEKPDFASGGMARVGYAGGKKVDLDRRMILKGMGALAALPVVGKFFKLAKPLAKTRDIRIKFKQDADFSYEGPESGWEGGSWLNLDFVPLTKKGTKILDDLAKNKKIEKSIDGKETYYGVANSEDGLMAVEDIKKMKGDMEIETTVSDKVKNSLKGEYETTKIYSGKDIDSKTILKESADDLVTDPIYANPVFTDEFTEEIINTINPVVKKASGGIAGQLHLNEGGRVPMIFGGSAGLKGLIASIKAGLNKGRPEKIKTLFPKYSADEKELLKLGEKYLPKDSATLAAKEIEAKAEGIQVLIDRLKHDKKLLKQQAENKAMKDPNLDFLMESLEKTMPEAYGPHLKKYTNIDKDILQLETIKKNLIMKDRKLNAEGGIAGQLHLNQGGRAKFQDGLSAFQEGQQIIGSGGDANRPNVEGGRIVYDLGDGTSIYESPIGFELIDENGVYTSIGPKESIGTLDDLLDSGRFMRDPFTQQGESKAAEKYTGEDQLIKDFNLDRRGDPQSQVPTDSLVKRDGQYFIFNGTDYEPVDEQTLRGTFKNANAPVTQTAPVTTQAASTGIQTIPGEKFAVNIMRDERGNVMKDQSMAELARETGMAPGIRNLPINSMSDVMRMVGPGESVAEGTAYNPPKKISPLADPRMARSYEENIRLMGDPRMQPPMPMGGMPIGVMPPPGSFSNSNVTAANPGGYASQDEAIADLGIERYNQLYAKGGRIGYASGLKVYPKINITETGQTPVEGIDVGVQDMTYGGTGLYQGDNWFAGAEGLTGKTKVDVTADGQTLYKDTMSKDDALNYIIGLGEAEGDKFQIKSDEDFNNVQIVFKKKFNQGGRASLSNGGLANILGV